MTDLSCAATPLEAPDADGWAVQRALTVLRVDGATASAGLDDVVEEVPVALVFNGISHAVMLASPADLEDFGLGFSLSEGILTDPSELYDVECIAGARGIEIRMKIASSRFMALKARRRSLAGRSGCGLCGVDSLEAVARPLPVAPQVPALQSEAVARALDALPRHQPLRETTGAVHAAAWADADGHILALREDVGRHNALDKLVGHLARRPGGPGRGFALVSSRASYEMVAKVAALGIAHLVAVSAPTALAVRLAEQSGITLAGFARGNRMVVYSHPDGFLAPTS